MDAGPHCTFFLGDLCLALEARRVQEVMRSEDSTEVPLAHPALRGLINLRGHIVPVVDLRVRLDLPPAAPGSPQINVLVRTASGPVALLMDRAGEVERPPAGSFGAVPDTVQGPARSLLRGAFKLPDRFLLCLDPDQAADL